MKSLVSFFADYAIITSSVSFAIFLISSCHYIDIRFPYFRENIFLWLIDDKDSPKLHSIFSSLLGNLFGDKYISLRSFLISSFISFVIPVLFLILSINILNDSPNYFINKNYTLQILSDIGLYEYLFLVILYINIWSDYISIVQTRYFMKYAEENGMYLFLYIIDLTLSISFFVIPYIILTEFGFLEITKLDNFDLSSGAPSLRDIYNHFVGNIIQTEYYCGNIVVSLKDTSIFCQK